MKLNNHSYLNMRTQFPYPQTALWYVSQKKKSIDRIKENHNWTDHAMGSSYTDRKSVV